MTFLRSLPVAAALCLALHAARALASPEDECGGPGALFYDWGDNYTLYSRYRQDFQPLCSPARSVTSASVAQLFTPPALPWKLTRVCFALYLHPFDDRALPRRATVYGTVSLYPVELLPVYGPGDRLSYATFSRELSYDPSAAGNASSKAGVVPTWISVDVSGLSSPLVAWNKGVFVGVSFWTCEFVEMVGVRMRSQKRLKLTFSPDNGAWYTHTATDAFAIRATGQHFSGVPPRWVCDRAKYGDGNCDCNCGASDVDCNSNFTSDCGPGHVCDQSGRCVAVDWDKRGVCSPYNYWQYDGCQCECGAATDPDCYDKNAPVSACSKSPLQPYCDTRDDGAVCRDCLDQSLNTTCPGNWLCVSGKCASPRGWTCPSYWYNDDKHCNCKCGIYDPDCDNETLKTFGCVVGEVCNYLSECAKPDPVEECDGGQGCLNCMCTAGFYPKSPMAGDCETPC
eukprot:m51a1_g7245 hypothetical protein (454) ;mRNA; f:120920-123024